MRGLRHAVLLGGMMVLALPMAGCANALLGAAAMKFYTTEDVNLAESSYAAADYILQQSNTYYDRFTPIAVLPLSDESRMDLSSRFGRVVGNQVGSRFGQLGYNVNLSEVSLTDGGIQAKPSSAPPKIAISGTYKRERPEMEINLHITEIESGYRIASFQYFVPYDSDIRKMSEPEIRIMRVR